MLHKLNNNRSRRMTRIPSIILLALTIIVCAHAFVPSSGSQRSTSSLPMSKNSNRARVEKMFDDLMDNDWRVFRAKMVASEQLQEETKTPRDEKTRTSSKPGETLAYFASFVSPAPKSVVDEKSFGNKDDIFLGDTIGGVIRPEDLEDLPDPFVSAAELPILMKPTADVDKHRWAHPIPYIEPGAVLIANENLGGTYHQTVVLIIGHNEKGGTTGIVINRPMQGDLRTVASAEPDSKLDSSLKIAFSNTPVAYGGPVLPDEYSVLHGFGQVDGSEKLASGVFIGGAEELMNEVRISRFDPSRALFVKGHAAWKPDQLAQEITKGVWYTASVSSDLIMRYAGAPITTDDNPNDLWSDILSCMGGKYLEIAKKHANVGDQRLMP